MRFQLLLFLLLGIFFSIKAQDPMQLIDHVQQGNLSHVKNLVNSSNVNTLNAQQENLLLIATRNNNLPMAKLLIEKGANPNQQDRINDNAFLYTGVSGNAAMAKLFIENGARFDLYNRYNGTTLIPAAERGHVELVKLLSSTPNFPINHVNRLGWTALMEAVLLGDGSKRYVEIVQILLNAGADKTIADSNGVSALQHAEKKGFKKIADLLR
jgi:ankyrin repeat protein